VAHLYETNPFPCQAGIHVAGSQVRLRHLVARQPDLAQQGDVRHPKTAVALGAAWKAEPGEAVHRLQNCDDKQSKSLMPAEDPKIPPHKYRVAHVLQPL
jgi:hypothetical protein